MIIVCTVAKVLNLYVLFDFPPLSKAEEQAQERMQAEETEELYQTVLRMLNATTRKTQKKEWVSSVWFIPLVLINHNNLVFSSYRTYLYLHVLLFFKSMLYYCVTLVSTSLFALDVTALFIMYIPVSHCPHHLCLNNRSLRLYEKLLKVAEKGHQKAMEKVAYAMLFGDYMHQNVSKAKEMFEKLAVEGSPKAQMVQFHSKIFIQWKPLVVITVTGINHLHGSKSLGQINFYKSC